MHRPSTRAQDPGPLGRHEISSRKGAACLWARSRRSTAGGKATAPFPFT